MKLKKLISNCEIIKLVNFKNVEISNLNFNSKQIENGGLFFAIKGKKNNGEKYVEEAIKNGCVAVVSENVLQVEIPQIIVKDARIAMSIFSSNFYNNPTKKLKIISVVGTNGKTTTSTIIYNILKDNGINVGLIGTNGIFFNNINLPNDMTTPDPIELYYTFNQMVMFGIEYVVIEVSAHAIYLNKMYGVKSEIGVFTNISNEHLDYFKTMNNYANVKVGFFNKNNMKECVVNVDDEYGKQIAYNCGIPCVSYGIAYPANVFAIDIKTTLSEMRFVANVENEILKIKTKLVGDYNVYNLLAGITVAKMLKISNSNIVKSVANMQNVSGRWEVFDLLNNNKIIVDYAHTPDGFEKILSLIKFLRPAGKIITLFGCVGYSDKQKRKEMGCVADKYSDCVVLTSDNLCGKDFNEVCADIDPLDKHIKIQDRESAVKYSYGLLKEGDTLVLLGKGNETVQKDTQNYVYNELEVVKQLQKKEMFE